MPDTKAKLLIVDDEPTTRAVMSILFTQVGYTVRLAEDGFSALLEIRREVPDILLSDLNMPGMSGFELLSVVRRRFPSIQVVAMSGAFSGGSAQPGVAADIFYEKASSVAGLLNAVEAIGHPERLPVEHPRTTTPIWISCNGRELSGEETIMIGCPECLRIFPQASGKEEGVVQRANCTYCRSPIDYAVVYSANPESPQAFQGKAPPSAATSSGGDHAAINPMYK